jgi:membrane protein involved in D-alanine export
LDEGYKNVNLDQLMQGWRFVVYGLLLKYVLAEMVMRYWLPPEGIEMTTFLEHANNAISYTLYLYFDFAGYSLLAMGLGYMFGIQVPQNFDFPFLSVNPREFWQRWHITLGDWLRDYFFRPIYKWLSGFKSLGQFTLAKQNVSLFCTFLLMGLWNGSEWHFILSGATFGLYSTIHNTYVYHCKKSQKDIIFGNANGWVVKGISMLLMNICVIFAIYLFSGRLK